MKKICIIGCGGAGKSTLARKLGEVLDIPVYHLDLYFWKPNWVEGNNVSFAVKQAELMQNSKWILEGNYSGTFHVRFPNADTIIYMDFSRPACLKNICKRYIKYHGQTREDLPEGCFEKLDWQFTKWVWDYPTRTRPNTLAALEMYKNKNVIILKSRKEVESFVNSYKVLQTIPA